MSKIKNLITFCILFGLLCFCIAWVRFVVLYPIKYKDEIKQTAYDYNLEPSLIASLINAESSFDTNAISKRGAIGLMQLQPETATEIANQLNITNFNQEDLLLPNINIQLGCFYLRKLLDIFNNLDSALCAYNAGPNTVLSWLQNPEYSQNGTTLDIIPYPETQKYLQKIKNSINIYQKYF